MAIQAKESFCFTLVGATGVVGKEMLRILEERQFPVRELRPVASEKSLGKSIEFRGQDCRLQVLGPAVFEGSDLAFFTAGNAISKEYVPMAAKYCKVVVDNSSAFRMDVDVSLAVPEVNPSTLDAVPKRKIISVANCSTIQLVVALAPLHRFAKIRRIVLSTYQSTSGAGRTAMEELSKQVSDLYNYRESTPKAFPRRIAFNVIPQIGEFQSDGGTFEESKIVEETRKILGDSTIGISATAVRVPTFHSHAQSVNIETERPLSVAKALELLHGAAGVEVLDESEGGYPTPTDVTGRDEVCVGRIRKDESRENCLNLWIVADNLRKGAALNAVQILEKLRERNLI